ncbi:MAG: hypothetical protein CMN84_12355 [Spongiibacteraceae bacterium]|jgi:hypothetical protein|nr:hypothetical protein [Spongiibacteraceae bacterium]|tara:strand:- start:153 stop:494 length:342 start_codon:yes stop_codon:yes gene_type:complete
MDMQSSKSGTNTTRRPLVVGKPFEGLTIVSKFAMPSSREEIIGALDNLINYCRLQQFGRLQRLGTSTEISDSTVDELINLRSQVAQFMERAIACNHQVSLESSFKFTLKAPAD